MRMKCVAVALACLLGLCAVPARAESILLDTFVGPTPSGSNYDFTYNMFVTADSRVEEDDFFVIFDFNGFVSAAAPAGWTATTEATSTITGDLGGVDTTSDSAAITNVRFTRTSGGTVFGESALGAFVITSIYGDTEIGLLGALDTQTIAGEDLKAVNTDFVPVAAVPMPAAAWGGLGLLSVLGAARIRKACKA